MQRCIDNVKPLSHENIVRGEQQRPFCGPAISTLEGNPKAKPMLSAQPHRGHRATSPMSRHSYGTNTRNKTKETGSFSDTAKPLNTEVGGGTTTSAPTLPNQCEYPRCGRAFTSKTGLGVHQRYAHRAWYDAKHLAKQPPKKVRWTHEELFVLARREATLKVQTGTCSLSQLHEGSGRTLEAIKGQKKKPAYKELVKEALLELEEEARTVGHIKHGPPILTTHTEAEHHPCLPTNTTTDDEVSLNALIKKAAATLAENSPDDVHPTLLYICRRVNTLTNKKLRMKLAALIPKLIPSRTRRPQRTRQTIPPLTTISNKERRRLLYKRTQAQWLKNPGRCVKDILGINILPGHVPPKECMIPYWKTKMTSTTRSTPGYSDPGPPTLALWAPIEIADIAGCYPHLNSAMGPDGIHSRDVRKIEPRTLAILLNLLMLCDRPPDSLLEARTVLIPKKQETNEPGDFRPLSISSVLTRCLHKILAKRVGALIPISAKQSAFRPVDGCSINTFLVDKVLKYHREHFKPLYIATTDIAKAYDSITHESLRDTMLHYAFPAEMVAYVMSTYHHGWTRLACDGWESEPVHPQAGVKQGDPLSPALFNLAIDRVLTKLPDDIGAAIGDTKLNAVAFADDLVLMASSVTGLQRLIDITTASLGTFGLLVNPAKSHTVAMKNIPGQKKCVIDAKQVFRSGPHTLPALNREDEWTYLGIPYSPEGRIIGNVASKLEQQLALVSKAPLKPQQRLFALRTFIVPATYHRLTLGKTHLGFLRKLDNTIRRAVRKWLALPLDCSRAYIHADHKDGGLSVPSLRWVAPEMRKRRLQHLADISPEYATYVQEEIDICNRRLDDHGILVKTREDVQKRWATLLHKSVDGASLAPSKKVPQQHQWVRDGSRFLSGADYLNSCKLRINALPTRSRCGRGRPETDRFCRGGCNAVETLNHVLQVCHRTHGMRIRRHNAISGYIAKACRAKGHRVLEEPRIRTSNGLHKPDLLVITSDQAYVIDAQVINEHFDLNKAHQTKSNKYKTVSVELRELSERPRIQHGSATLNWKGLWSSESVRQLVEWKLIALSDIKVLSCRALVGGIAAYRTFQSTTAIAGFARKGIG